MSKKDPQDGPPPLIKKARASIIDKKYLVGDRVGTGVSSVVFEVTGKGTGSEGSFAMKRLAIEDPDGFDNKLLFISECKYLSSLPRLGIPHVIPLIDYLVDGQFMYIVTPMGRDLFGEIRKGLAGGGLAEWRVKRIVKSLLETMIAMHAKNVVHRDIKPENVVLLKGKGNESEPVLIDWADALIVKNEEIYTELIGTPAYMGAERWRRHKGWEMKAADVFALGATCFESVCGKRCFRGATNDAIRVRVLKNEWAFPDECVVSDRCVDFIRKCLCPNANRRWTAQKLNGHAWIQSD